MKNQQSFPILGITGAVLFLVASPAQADVVKVTDVQVKQTASGIEVILKTSDGGSPQVFTTKFNETFQSDLIGTQLQLPSAKEFRVNNPGLEIGSVSVTQLYANTVRVRVTGEKEVPAAVVAQKDGRLVVSLTPPEPTAQKPAPTLTWYL